MTAEQPANTQTPTVKPRRRRKLLIFGGVLAGLVWFAPAIIGHTALRQQLLPALAPQYPAGIEVGSASLSWTSPVILRDVTFRDLQDVPFLQAKEVTTSESLWQLTTNSAGVHPITISGAVIDVRFRADGSNLEDVAAPFADPTSTIWPGVALELTDSTLKISTEQGGDPEVFDDLHVSVKKSHEQGVPYDIAVTAKPGGGAMELKLAWVPPPELTSPVAGDGELTLATAQFPTPALRPVFYRLGIDDVITAAVTSDLKTGWVTSQGPGLYQIDGQIQSGPWELRSPRLAAAEQMRSEFLRCAVATKIRGETVDVTRLDVDSDLGRLHADGTVDLTELAATGEPLKLLSSLADHQFDVQGRLDLAKLAATLPQTLHIRAGTDITGGTIDWRIAGGPRNDGRGWETELATTGLTAVHDGQPLTWDQPIRLSFSSRTNGTGATTMQLDCRSDFLQASLSGNPGKASATIHCDLDRLAAEAGRFLDLGNLELAGQLRGNLAVDRRDARINAQYDASVDQLYLAGLAAVPWDEPRLDLTGSFSVQPTDGEGMKIHAAVMQITATGYQATVQLASATTWPNSAVPLNVTVAGDLGRMSPQLRMILPMEGRQVGGNFQLQTQLQVGREAIHYRDANMTVERLDLRDGDRRISEPSVRIASSGAYDLNQSRFTSSSTVISTATLNARAQQISLSLGGQSPQMSADVDFAGRLQDLLELTGGDAATAAADGRITARLNLVHNAGRQQVRGDIVINDFVVNGHNPTRERSAEVATLVSQSTVSEPLWREAQLVVATDLTYDAAADAVQIAKLKVEGNQWRIRAAGGVNDLSTSMTADVNGEVQCDWEQLVAQHRELVGDDLKIVGKGPFPFSLQGPLAVADASGDATMVSQLDGRLNLGWEAADFYGLRAGQAEIATRLKDGVFRVKSLDIPVSEGRLLATPRVTLNTDPMIFYLPPGPVIQNVRLSPEMCHTWLKYVAPMLADATRVDGRLSASTSSSRVPLDDWQTGRITGELQIHSADVRPGPLAQQFLDVAEQVKAVIRRGAGGAIVNPQEAWMKIDEQTVPFRMANGRVHHEGLTIQVRDVVIRTRGSVGMDESIALIAEIPIQDAWLKDDRFLAALKGQVVQVPITGTLTKPKVDPNVLQDLARQIGTAAGASLIEGELQNQLQRLFRNK